MLSSVVVRGFMIFLIVGLPLMALRNSRLEEQVEAIEKARSALYLSAAVTLLLIAGLTAIVAAWQGLPGAALGWTVQRPVAELGAGAAVTAAGLLIVWLSGRIGEWLGAVESPLLRALLPRTGRERRAFLLLAGVGAVAEEYIYRGFILHVLADWTGGPWGAAAAAALSFGLAHGYQRLNGIVRSVALGFVLAVPVIWTGSLFPAVLGHFWINAAIGSGGWRWLMPEVEASSGQDLSGEEDA
jgi:membrane protease YdiL (CAAX protease family)